MAGSKGCLGLRLSGLLERGPGPLFRGALGPKGTRSGFGMAVRLPEGSHATCEDPLKLLSRGPPATDVTQPGREAQGSCNRAPWAAPAIVCPKQLEEKKVHGQEFRRICFNCPLSETMPR